MSQHLTVIAQLRAKPGQETALREALTALVPPTLAEPGCITYDLHRAVDDHGSFHFYEVWSSPEEHAANLKTPHLRSFLARSADLLAGDIQVTLLHRLAPRS
ncbi:quinol monooxygenase YgiN [Actinoplanes octamycinicus]|uniref:Quinol monooxygenase YgiN n=1 Tax=Actinoplanes octamycinicus TaxID=135948 RepID=A0A7W7H174_9ACTN|nr:putative quinol monooxygenase [Actinoplanes octamycinicus]MBB4741877.1 quinol monooxygenase YgiN [Actinoplanes octamycinicus]GIE60640.1 antibiotic biosynthesis monooxygenase [Actinoplanes octamycinicus]